MRGQFPLFQSHLDLAHRYWEQLVKPGDWVIDATCGNGYDTLKLCQLAIAEGQGKVIALDLQPEAIASTQSLLESRIGVSERSLVELHCQSHTSFPSHCREGSIQLIVYNLGYLPKGNKSLTTTVETTHLSLQQALPLIRNGGAISITCYPGHEEGKKEEAALLSFAAKLPPTEWNVCFHRWMNRADSPSLLLLTRAMEKYFKIQSRFCNKE